MHFEIIVFNVYLFVDFILCFVEYLLCVVLWSTHAGGDGWKWSLGFRACAELAPRVLRGQAYLASSSPLW